MGKMTSILIVDDHSLVREGIMKILLSIADVKFCDEAENGEEALKKLEERHFDVVLLDIAMKVMDGIEVARQIKMLYKNTKIIMCSSFKERGQIIKLIELGVEGYILKSADKYEIQKALTHLSISNRYFTPEVFEIWQNHKNKIATGQHETNNEPNFTPREIEIIKLLCKGRSAKQIAKELVRSYFTVRSHRIHIMKKMEVHNIAGIMNYVTEHALFIP